MNILSWNRVINESRGMLSAWMDLLYPRVCEVCGKSLVKGEKYLCSFCVFDFPFADRNFAIGEKILEQFAPSYRPKQLFALFYYDKYSDYRKLIYLVKYQSYKKLGYYLGQMLGEQIFPFCQADCIVPIPLHKKREKQRGFNQALEIAKGINEVLRIELVEDVVVRTRNNVSQTGKNTVERMNNVENIFEGVALERLQGKHILLVDDVITTGATIGSCLRTIATVKDVSFSFACLAKTV